MNIQLYNIINKPDMIVVTKNDRGNIVKVNDLKKNPSLKFINPNSLNNFLFIYFIILPFLFVQFKYNYITSLVISFIGFLSYKFGSRIVIPKLFYLSNVPKDNIMRRIFLVIFVVSDLLRVSSLLLVGISQESYNLTFLESGGSNALYLSILSLSFTYTKYYIYSYYMNKNKKYYWFLFGLTLLSSLNSRQRMSIISALAFFGIFGVFMKYIKITWPMIISVLISFPILSLGYLIRRDFVGNASIVELLETVIKSIELQIANGSLEKSLKMSMESFDTFEIYNQLVNDNLILPIHGIFRFFFNFIPRSIWPNKPLPLQNMIAMYYVPEAYLKGGGVFATIFGDGYLNFGVLGVVFILGLFGSISNSLFKNALRDTDTKFLNVALYGTYMRLFLDSYRGIFSDTFWQFILLILVFKLLNLLERVVIK